MRYISFSRYKDGKTIRDKFDFAAFSYERM